MKLDKVLKEIRNVINKHRLIEDRAKALEEKGYGVWYVPAPGQAGTYKVLPNKKLIRVQVGYTEGEYYSTKYASCVTLDLNQYLK